MEDCRCSLIFGSKRISENQSLNFGDTTKKCWEDPGPQQQQSKKNFRLPKMGKEQELIKIIKTRITVYFGHEQYELPQLIIGRKLESKRGIRRKLNAEHEALDRYLIIRTAKFLPAWLPNFIEDSTRRPSLSWQ